MVERIVERVRGDEARQFLDAAVESGRAEVPASKRGVRRSGEHGNDELRTHCALRSTLRFSLWRAVLAGDAEATRAHFVRLPGLPSARNRCYICEMAKGASRDKIAAVRSLQQTFRQLLRRLPRLGLIRETCQLIHTARLMERNHPLGPGLP